jgi:hypothetical protein
MNITTYAAAHIDGELDFKSIKIGVTETPEQAPAVFFQMIAGVQRHPVYAINHEAIEVYSFSEAARKNGQGTIEINLIANLVSGSHLTCPLAAKITWHTSRKIRTQAESMMSGLKWPSQKILKFPGKD